MKLEHAARVSASIAADRCSDEERQEHQRIARSPEHEYSVYESVGGKLSFQDWTEEKKRNSNLSAQQVATRVMALRFWARKLPENKKAGFILCHLNIPIGENSLQYRAFINRPYDFCDNETFWRVFDSFYQLLLKEGVTPDDALCEALCSLSMSEERFQDFTEFLDKQKSPQDLAASQPTAPSQQSNPPQQPVRPTFLKPLYVLRGSNTEGPYTYERLVEAVSAGRLSTTILVAYDGAPEWVGAAKFIARVEGGAQA